MYKEIRRIDTERNILQITSVDERWYARDVPHPETGLPIIIYRPSVTWICDFYPKGRGFEHWLKKNGDEADQIARLAADRGYKVHRAIAHLNAGEVVRIDDVFENPTTGEAEPLSPDEYAGVMSYVEWWEKEGMGNLKILKYEHTVWPNTVACSEKYGLPESVFEFAGTIDLEVERIADGTRGVIDCKTSLDIWPSMEMQVSAYGKALGSDWQAILQLNYRRNKKQKYKYSEITDCFDLFIATQKIWAHETAGTVPLQRDFPLEMRLKGV